MYSRRAGDAAGARDVSTRDAEVWHRLDAIHDTAGPRGESNLAADQRYADCRFRNAFPNVLFERFDKQLILTGFLLLSF